MSEGSRPSVVPSQGESKSKSADVCPELETSHTPGAASDASTFFPPREEPAEEAKADGRPPGTHSRPTVNFTPSTISSDTSVPGFRAPLAVDMGDSESCDVEGSSLPVTPVTPLYNPGRPQWVTAMARRRGPIPGSLHLDLAREHESRGDLPPETPSTAVTPLTATTASSVQTPITPAANCIICRGPPKKNLKYCHGCYCSLWQHVRRVMDLPGWRKDPDVQPHLNAMGDQKTLLGKFATAVARVGRPCPTDLRCPASCYAIDALPGTRCARCRMLACIRHLPDLAFRLLVSAAESVTPTHLDPPASFDDGRTGPRTPPPTPASNTRPPSPLWKSASPVPPAQAATRAQSASLSATPALQYAPQPAHSQAGGRTAVSADALPQARPQAAAMAPPLPRAQPWSIQMNSPLSQPPQPWVQTRPAQLANSDMMLPAQYLTAPQSIASPYAFSAPTMAAFYPQASLMPSPSGSWQVFPSGMQGVPVSPYPQVGFHPYSYPTQDYHGVPIMYVASQGQQGQVVLGAQPQQPVLGQTVVMGAQPPQQVMLAPQGPPTFPSGQPQQPQQLVLGQPSVGVLQSSLLQPNIALPGMPAQPPMHPLLGLPQAVMQPRSSAAFCSLPSAMGGAVSGAALSFSPSAAGSAANAGALSNTPASHVEASPYRVYSTVQLEQLTRSSAANHLLSMALARPFPPSTSDGSGSLLPAATSAAAELPSLPSSQNADDGTSSPQKRSRTT
eukprot:m.48529 g.48529  ORF g.48529 m.48529 type:complete len:731 (-) comp6038_c1_seq3:104-2296(-)